MLGCKMLLGKLDNFICQMLFANKCTIENCPTICCNSFFAAEASDNKCHINGWRLKTMLWKVRWLVFERAIFERRCKESALCGLSSWYNVHRRRQSADFRGSHHVLSCQPPARPPFQLPPKSTLALWSLSSLSAKLVCVCVWGGGGGQHRKICFLDFPQQI